MNQQVSPSSRSDIYKDSQYKEVHQVYHGGDKTLPYNGSPINQNNFFGTVQKSPVIAKTASFKSSVALDAAPITSFLKPLREFSRNNRTCISDLTRQENYRLEKLKAVMDVSDSPIRHKRSKSKVLSVDDKGREGTVIFALTQNGVNIENQYNADEDNDDIHGDMKESSSRVPLHQNNRKKMRHRWKPPMTKKETYPPHPALATTPLLDEKMRETYSDTLFGARTLLTIADIQKRVAAKLELSRNLPEIASEVSQSATHWKRQRARMSHSKRHNTVYDAIWRARNEHITPDGYQITEENYPRQLSSTAPGDDSGNSSSLGDTSTGEETINKEPDCGTIQVSGDDTKTAIKTGNNIVRRSSEFWKEYNENRRKSHSVKLQQVTNDRMCALMSHLSHHKRVAESAENYKMRMKHSPFKAQWCKIIYLITFHRKIADRAIRITVYRTLQSHYKMLSGLYHAWHDPTEIIVTKKRYRLTKARIFMALIIARMWGWIAHRREKILLIRRCFVDLKDAGRFAVGVRKLFRNVNISNSIVRRFLFMRRFSLLLMVLQWRKVEEEFYDQKRKEINDVEYVIDDEKKTKVPMTSRKKIQLLAKMSKEDQAQHKVDELIARDQFDYKTKIPLSIMAVKVMTMWSQSRKEFISYKQEELYKADLAEYHLKLLGKSMSPARANTATKTNLSVPKKRNPPRFIPHDIMLAAVEEAHNEHQTVLHRMKKKAAIKVVRDKLECEYTAVKNRLVQKAFEIGETDQNRLCLIYGPDIFSK